MEIQTTALLSIGELADDSSTELFRVVTPFLLSDGRVVVPLGEAGAIRVFATDGTLLTTVGRAGRGPGEFASLTSAWARGDTIEAFDGGLARIVRFLPNGSTSVVPLVNPPSSAQAAIPGVLPDGWVLAGVAAGSRVGRDQIAVHAFSGDGSHQLEIARTQGIVRYSPARSSRPVPPHPGHL